MYTGNGNESCVSKELRARRRGGSGNCQVFLARPSRPESRLVLRGIALDSISIPNFLSTSLLFFYTILPVASTPSTISHGPGPSLDIHICRWLATGLGCSGLSHLEPLQANCRLWPKSSTLRTTCLYRCRIARRRSLHWTGT